MEDIKTFYKKYATIDIGDLSSNQKDEMYKILGNTKPEDLHSIEDHRLYIEVLQKLRMATLKDMERAGAKFLQTMKSLLTVGEDGVYSNGQRFIYELIQNVDDCDYENIEDCQLDIQFNYHTSPGTIILTYNEKGFKPENVFAITGIAEKSKNISADKVEIGEKGIGFKSVFGIADKVHIESGCFSFELYRDSFTVPIPKYGDFTPVDGTRLTLEMPAEMVHKVYRSLVEQYMKGDAALNKNPILFLNKLTHLRMFFDGLRYIEFDVERKTPEQIGDISFEDDVVVSIDMKDHHNGIDEEYSHIVHCKRYTQPLIYGKLECKARYGKDAPFDERRHSLVAIFPEKTDELKDFKGLMYSFLPTQIGMTAPIILHVPFKLDGSREFVDPQGRNAWFTFTVEHLAGFLKKIYVHLAGEIRQDVISYIPNRHRFFFKKTNEKIQCLQLDELNGDRICEEKVFYTSDGSFESARDIVSFAKDEVLDDPVQIFHLLGENKKLFIPNTAMDMQWYGVRVISNTPALLFKRGLKDEETFKKIAEILDTIGKDLKYEKLIETCCPLILTRKQLLVISSHKRISAAFNEYSAQRIADWSLPKISFDDSLTDVDKKFQMDIKESIEATDLDQSYEDYLRKINYRFVVLDGIKQDFAIAGEDAIVLAEGATMGSFAALTATYDPRGVFVASLKIRQASERLNEADESLSNVDYLKLLRSVRVSLKNAFGSRMYNSYIQLINQAGTDKNRFLNELLQNADDCKYPDGETPRFDLQVNGDTIAVSYNEVGFTKQNVRAITAIGESTKKLLLDGKDRSIGEKGVGFKSVFGVAKAVEIHSNGFDFRLTDQTPTVPDKCEPQGKNKKTGTTLLFDMKADVSQTLNEKNILRLCLCLRNLKHITIQGVSINISDTETERMVAVGGRTYTFDKFAYDFTISDEEAISERSSNQRMINKDQRITMYLPKDSKSEKYPLYAGLPTGIDCYIPAIIDAPFELTTSRDNVVRSRWNEIVRDTIHKAIFRLMFEKREELRLDVLKYVRYVVPARYAVQNGISSCQTFSEEFLNRFDYGKVLRVSEILPVLNEDRFVAAREGKCIIIPEIIAFISKQRYITLFYPGTVIDTNHKNQYIPLLESIGCMRSSVDADLSCIQMAVDMIHDKKFRELLYSYLSSQDTRTRLIIGGLNENVKGLPIFPIRTSSGVEYVPYSKNIYTHDTRCSDSEFKILDTKVMSYQLFVDILGVRVNELTDEVYEARYQKNLVAYIRNNEISDKEKAVYVLNEFRNNWTNFRRCQATLRGIVSEIPMEMISGNCWTGNKFINERNLIFSGSTIKEFVVTEDFKELAEFLGCKDVLDIHYDDIDMDLEAISDEDIEDFQSDFTYYAEILGGFIRNGIITEEQIKKFHLEYLTISDDEDGGYEEFPGREVANLWMLKNHIRDQFTANPNPYVERRRVVHEPQNPVDKDAYTTAMYGSEYNRQKCFCQMCKSLISKNYIERNDIQRNPKYGWSQMYLSLCLRCSKDYVLLRNNESVWSKFIDNVLEADVEDEDTVEVEIGNRTLTFTATHLAEVQTIFELEGENL